MIKTRKSKKNDIDAAVPQQVARCSDMSKNNLFQDDCDWPNDVRFTGGTLEPLCVKIQDFCRLSTVREPPLKWVGSILNSGG